MRADNTSWLDRPTCESGDHPTRQRRSRAGQLPNRAPQERAQTRIAAVHARPLLRLSGENGGDEGG